MTGGDQLVAALTRCPVDSNVPSQSFNHPRATLATKYIGASRAGLAPLVGLFFRRPDIKLVDFLKLLGHAVIKGRKVNHHRSSPQVRYCRALPDLFSRAPNRA